MKFNMKGLVPAKVGNVLAKIGFSLKKNKPEILLGLGITGLVGAGVTACIATTKIDNVTDNHHARMEKLHEKAAAENRQPTGKETMNEYVKTMIGYGKLYGPSILLAIFSTGSLIASNHEHRERSAAAAVAYAALDKGYKTYRERVVERFGDEVDKELQYGRKKEVIETTVTDENGNETIVKEEVNTVDPTIAATAPYVKIFSPATSRHWGEANGHLSYLLNMLRGVQAVLDVQLQSRGFLFENEILDALGMPLTREGQFNGIRKDKAHPDKHVSLGLDELYGAYCEGSYKGPMKVDQLVLQLNLDGEILSKLDEDDLLTWQSERMR